MGHITGRRYPRTAQPDRGVPVPEKIVGLPSRPHERKFQGCVHPSTLSQQVANQVEIEGEHAVCIVVCSM